MRRGGSNWLRCTTRATSTESLFSLSAFSFTPVSSATLWRCWRPRVHSVGNLRLAFFWVLFDFRFFGVRSANLCIVVAKDRSFELWSISVFSDTPRRHSSIKILFQQQTKRALFFFLQPVDRCRLRTCSRFALTATINVFSFPTLHQHQHVRRCCGKRLDCVVEALAAASRRLPSDALL